MSCTKINGSQFRDMLIYGSEQLAKHASKVDALNVFPVPDGDTGTNMNLSMTSGAKEVKHLSIDHVGTVGASLAKGLLMGARGNSGVILSQLFRGFSKHIEQKPTLTTKEFADALNKGVETAYKAVMKPVEGTILTVAKDAAIKAVQIAEREQEFVPFMEGVLQEAEASLQRTPDLLPVLKEVGVVDSGGQGLVHVYEGFLSQLKGEELPSSGRVEQPSMNDLVELEHHKHAQGHISTEDIEFGYCTEFMVVLEEEKKTFDEEVYRQEISRFGDSLLVISDEELVKVHIHAEHPGEVLSYGQRYGSLINIKIENMRKQHAEITGGTSVAPAKSPKQKEKQKYGIVTVAMGNGIAELFRSIGAHAVIEGGQTMNPSTKDITKAIEEVNAETVFILPNNKNIVLAAQQAAELVETEAFVIPTKTVPQGLSALLAFNPILDAKANEEELLEAMQQVKSGQVTYAVRNTTIDGIEIAEGDYMGLAEGSIVLKEQDLLSASKGLLARLLDDDAEIVTVLVGEEAADDVVGQLIAYLEETYEDVEVEVHKGGQPLYPFIFSVE